MSDLKRRVARLEQQQAAQQPPANRPMNLAVMTPYLRELQAARRGRPSVITQDELKVMIEYLNENRRREIEGLPPLPLSGPTLEDVLQRIQQRDYQQRQQGSKAE